MTSETYGALVGWTSDDLNDRLVLRLESFERQDKTDPDDMHKHFLLMSKDQALLLSNYLLKESGHTPPSPRKPGLLKRLFP